jgi:hypothetical protein
MRGSATRIRSRPVGNEIAQRAMAPRELAAFHMNDRLLYVIEADRRDH